MSLQLSPLSRRETILYGLACVLYMISALGQFFEFYNLAFSAGILGWACSLTVAYFVCLLFTRSWTTGTPTLVTGGIPMLLVGLVILATSSIYATFGLYAGGHAAHTDELRAQIIVANGTPSASVVDPDQGRIELIEFEYRRHKTLGSLIHGTVQVYSPASLLASLEFPVRAGLPDGKFVGRYPNRQIAISGTISGYRVFSYEGFDLEGILIESVAPNEIGQPLDALAEWVPSPEVRDPELAVLLRRELFETFRATFELIDFS